MPAAFKRKGAPLTREQFNSYHVIKQTPFRTWFEFTGRGMFKRTDNGERKLAGVFDADNNLIAIAGHFDKNGFHRGLLPSNWVTVETFYMDTLTKAIRDRKIIARHMENHSVQLYPL